MRHCFALLVVLFGLGLVASARAAAPGLVWEAPASCPRAEQVRTALAETLGSADLSTTAVRAIVVRSGAQYRLDLTLRSEAAVTERRLFAERCETFVDLIALELTVAGTRRETPPPRPRLPLGWAARLTAGLGSGPTPRPSPSLGLAGALRLSRLRLELLADYELPRETRYIGLASVGARVQLVSGQLRGCWEPLVAMLALPMCLGVQAGAVRAEAIGIEPNEPVTRGWLALSASAALRYPRASAVALYLEVAGLLGLLRPTFGIRNLPPLFRPARLAVRGSAGIELQFD